MNKSNKLVSLSRADFLTLLFGKVQSQAVMLATIFSLGLLTLIAPSLSVASSDTTWSTPNYPNNYADHTDISQTIRVDGDSMVLTVNGVTEAGYDFVYINGEKYSGEFNNHLIAIDSNQVAIRFTSDYSIQHQGISIKAVPGTLWTTPNYPRDYANFTDVSETISLPNADSLKLTLQGETEENYDFLYINGKEYHGQFNNLEINIPNNQVDIRFTSDYSVVTPGATVLIEPVTKALTDTELQSHFHRQLRAGLGEAAAATGVAATIGSVCTSLGTFALLDPEPGTKVTAAVADGVCWLVAAAAGAGTYIVAKVSEHPESTAAAPHKVEKIDVVRPPIYDDGITQVTSIAIGNSYKIITSKPFLHNSYVIDSNNDYYNDAKILAEHQGGSQAQQALSRLKRYMKNEDRRRASAPCSQPEPQSEPSNRRRLQVGLNHYCMPALSKIDAPRQGNNETIKIHQVTQFQITEQSAFLNVVHPYGGYDINNIGSYGHQYATLQIDGILFDVTTKELVQPGQTLSFGHKYKILTLHSFPNQPEILPSYLSERGIANVFAYELDNTNLYQMNTDDDVRRYYRMLNTILHIYTADKMTLETEFIDLINHFTRVYQLKGHDTPLTRRQLMVLHGIALFMFGSISDVFEGPSERLLEQIDYFMQDIGLRGIIEENCPRWIRRYDIRNTAKLRQQILDTLEATYIKGKNAAL